MAPAPAEPGQRFYTMLLPGIPAAGGWLVGVPPALAEEPGEAQPASSCAARSRTCCVAVARFPGLGKRLSARWFVRD